MLTSTFHVFVHNKRFFFFFLQVWCPTVTASPGHHILLKFGLQDTLSYYSSRCSKTCPDFLLSAYCFGSTFLFLSPKLLSHLTSISAHFWAALALWEAVKSHGAVHIITCFFQFQGCTSSHAMLISVPRQ